MPFEIPTPQAIRDRLAGEVETAFPGADARSNRTVLGVLTRVWAMAAWPLHLFQRWLSRQVLPDTAEIEWLERHASLWGLTRRPALAAQGSVTLTGVTGAVVPAGTVLRRAGGIDYALDADATVTAGVATAEVTAVTAGTAGNAAAATPLTLVVPVAGIQPGAVVAVGGLTAGVDVESDEDLRARLVERIQEPPYGGRDADYVLWARTVPGVERVWVRPLWTGLGTVAVFFTTTGGALPTSPQIAAVEAAIAARRPVTVTTIDVLAPVEHAIDISIQVSPDTTAVRDAVEAAIAAFFARAGDLGQPVYLSQLSAAIDAALGEVWHEITVPSGATVALAANELPVLGDITWVTP